jgi:hypothetical protein
MPYVVLVSTKPLGIGPRGLTKLVQEFRVKAKRFQSSKLNFCNGSMFRSGVFL